MSRRPWNQLQVRARERRIAAVHEAGHFVMGRHLGLTDSFAWIAPHDGDPLADRAWIGQHSASSRQLDRLSVRRQMMIAVGGFVAEMCWDERQRPDEGLSVYDALNDPDSMSDSDWRLAGHPPGFPTAKLIQAAEDVEALLAPGAALWTQLLVAARSLIVEGEIKNRGKVHA